VYFLGIWLDKIFIGCIIETVKKKRGEYYMIEWLIGLVAAVSVVALAILVTLLFRELRGDRTHLAQQPAQVPTQTAADLRRARLEAVRRSREELEHQLEEEEELLELKEDREYYREELRKTKEARRAHRKKPTQYP